MNTPAMTQTGSAYGTARFQALALAVGAILTALTPQVAFSADGDLDPAFTNLCANSYVQSIAVKGDGKILVGGQFTDYNGVLRNRIAQLNADGTLDGAFNVGSVEEGYGSVEAIAVQGDGKVLIGGGFTPHGEPSFVNGAPNFVAIERLNANGSLDPSFNFDGYGNSSFYAMVVQDDGKIVVGGVLARDDGTLIDHLARINADGSIDGTFSRGVQPGLDVFTVRLQPDGKFLIGGDFGSYGGAPTPRIARLNADGSRDTSFNPGAGPNGTVYTTSVQADGKIIIAGGFSAVDAVSRVGIARLNPNGSLDTTFDPGTGADGAVQNSAIQFDGKIIITGSFFNYNGVARRGIARINPDGSLDLAFNPGPERAGGEALALQADGKILTDGANANAGFCGYVARLLSTPPPAPNPGPPLPAPSDFTVNGSATGFAVQPDSVLRMRVTQPANATRLIVRVQSSTTPANEGSWTDLNNGSFGRMIYDVTNGTYVLNTTTYPRVANVYFRTISTASASSSSISNAVGPFNLTSNAQHLGRTILSTTRNGVGAKINFRAFDETHPAGISMRVQSATSPGDENNWTDLADGNGGKMAAYRNPGDFFLDSNNYPAHGALYFRVVASAPGYVDSPSRGVGPFKLINSPSPNVTVTSPATSGGDDGSDFQDPVVLPFAPFTISANAAPNGGPAIKSLGLVYDGETIQRFTAASGGRSFKPPAPGDHVIEAFASDEVSIFGHAVPIYVRIEPPAGKIYNRVADGDWNDPTRWLDQALQNGVPGPNDFASITNYNVSLSQDVTVLAASLHGGSINGPGALTITGTFTVSAGTLPIPSLTIGSNGTLLLANESAIGMAGTLTNNGTVRLIGGAGITGLNNPETTAASDAVRGFDLGAAIRNIGRWLMGPRSGGKREKPQPTPQPTPDVPLVVEVATFANEGGQVIGQDVAGLLGQDAAGVIGQDTAGIVSSDGASIVSSDGASVIGQDPAGIDEGVGIISGGGGNIISGGGGNIAQPMQSGTDATTAIGGYSQTDGTTNLSGIRLTGPVTLSGGVLTGSGLIEGSLTNDGGSVAPGNVTGSIGVTGNFSQGVNGALLLEVAGQNPAAQQFDQLKIGGSAAFGGLLSIRTINGFTPDPNVPLVPLSYTSRGGDFASTTGNVQIDLRDTGANLVVSGGNPSTPTIVTAVSRKIHANAASFDVDLPLNGNPGVEPRRSSVDGDYQIIFTFSEPVTLDGASITAGGGSVASYAVNGATVTVNLTGVVNAQLITLSLTSVTNGLTVVNPALTFGVLVGDGNGDGTVNSGDATGTRNRSGQATDANNARYDANADGTINGGDATVVRSRSGNSIYY